MKPSFNHQPIYQQFIERVQIGLDLLDAESQLEVKVFIAEQQHVDGAFTDRGGRPDLYYSLFGYWLALAMNQNDVLTGLKAFAQNTRNEESVVDRFALMLIQQSLLKKRISGWALIRAFLRDDHPINFSYQLFLSLLLLDAGYGRKRWMYAVLRLLLRFYNVPEGAPCSLVAALTVARYEVGLPTAKMQQQLLTYFEDGIGFRAFEQVQSGDLLSMGVALFALQKSGFDTRLIAPTCFDFVQQCYDKGAFLSGDGDANRDVEYTFYGLLALGCLKEN
ncbi:hypothetical protein [Sunxiuqinia rutila]|uniref:hypothetical protein n=1 Tax=Sunxiuqinia rutila TaxID=1397841 RepID=UPI003D35C8A7